MRKFAVFMITLIFGITASVAVLTSYVPQAGAEELCVDPNIAESEASSCYKSIQAAISAARNGDVIVVNPGTYKENITFSGKAITLRSTNPDDPNVVEATVIDGDQKGSVVVFDHGEAGGSRLRGFTLQNGGKAASGAGIRCQDSSPDIENCIITGNSTTLSGGGGISCQSSSPRIKNCTIKGNTAFTNGGGIFCTGSSSPSIENCTLISNTARFSGGGIFCEASSPSLTNCVIAKNTATAASGGGVSCNYSSPHLANCTIAENTAKISGGGIFGDFYSAPVLVNCILWQNKPQEVYGCTPVITYSDIQGGYEGTGNIDADPLLDHSIMGKYRLWYDSPCIDAGTNEGAPDRDMEGKTRSWSEGGACDMGAYEIQIHPPKRHVDPSGIAPDGSPCYQSVQAAIDEARNMDVIIIHQGTYKENIDFSGKVITLKSADPNNPEIVVTTVIDGDQKGSAVTFNHGEGRCSLMKGLTLQNGKDNGLSCDKSSPTIENCLIIDSSGEGISCKTSSPYIKGCTVGDNSDSGIYCTESSSPHITNCLITGNNESGIFSYGSPVITNCTISGNSGNDGGGIYCHGSPVITNCTISGNSAVNRYGGSGGGISCYGSLVITNCTISGNSAVRSSRYGGGNGGGISCSGSLVITNCTIKENSGGDNGGGIFCSGLSPAITNCIITQNSVESNGGGIYCSGSPVMTNCIINQNSAPFGGGIYCDNGSKPNIIHCIIIGNMAADGGALYCDENSSPVIKACILWNDSPLYNEISVKNNSTPTVTYSDVQMVEGAYPGTGNINADPLFRNPAAKDFQPRPDSPIIDAADPNSSIPTQDMNNKVRPQDGNGDGISTNDMGAYEYGISCYQDSDNDSYGNPLASINFLGESCPDGYVLNDQDCDDTDPAIHPNAAEDCQNLRDDNCNGKTDDCPPVCPYAFTSSFIATLGATQGSASFGVDSRKVTRHLPPSPPSPYIEIALRAPDSSVLYETDVRSCQTNFTSYHWIVNVTVKGISGGSYPLLTWEPGNLPEMKDHTWMLIEGESQEEGGRVLVDDMKSYSSYQMEANEGEYSIIWVKTVIPPFHLHLKEGWNLISLPLIPEGSTRQDILPDAPSVWYFDPVRLGYTFIEEGSTMRVGQGYWVLVERDITYEISGSYNPDFSLTVKKGWNMVGALSTTTAISVSTGNIRDIYEFTKEGYSLVETPVLEAGKGYWVSVSEDGILQGTPDAASRGRFRARKSSDIRYRTVDSVEIWSVKITGIGQERSNYVTQGNITFGLATEALRRESPPPPPSSTILLSLYDSSIDLDYSYDLQAVGSETKIWLLRIQNNPKPGSVYRPLLRWEIPASLEGTLELQSATGEVLVPDMKAATSYQTKTGDREQLLTIVWKGKQASTNTSGTALYYLDNDSDGYGTSGNGRQLSAPEGKYTALNPGDCDDHDPQVYPGALEVCDNKDNNCNDMVDEKAMTVYYRDADNDGYGNPGISRQSCTQPSGYVSNANAGDCDDGNAAIHPGAPEVCDDGQDNDCDGKVDPSDICASQSSVSVKVVDAQGYPGQTEVVVPVEIVRAAGVAGLDFTLSYDPDILTAEEVRAASIIGNFSSQANIEQNAGKVHFSMAHSSGLTSEQGTFATIIFKIEESAQEGTSVPLALETLRVYSENGESYRAISSNGEIQITGKGIIGDLNQDQEITSADAIYILKIAVGKITPTEYQEWAGDVNQGGWINSGDAILVLRSAAKMKTIFFLNPDRGFPNTTLRIVGWNFGDAPDDTAISFDSFTAEPISWSNHEITTVLPSQIQSDQCKVTLGTAGIAVSNFRMFTADPGWTAAITRLRGPDPSAVSDSSPASNSSTGSDSSTESDSLVMPKESPKTLSIPTNVALSPGEQIIVPVEIDDATGVAGIDLVLDYDPALLVPVNAECTSLTDGFVLMFHAPGDGRLKVSLSNHTPISSGSGDLVNLAFQVTSPAQELSSTGLVIENAGLYNGNAELMKGTIWQRAQLIIQGESIDNDPPSTLPVPYFSFPAYASFPSVSVYSLFYPWFLTSVGQLQPPFSAAITRQSWNQTNYWLYWLQGFCPYSSNLYTFGG